MSNDRRQAPPSVMEDRNLTLRTLILAALTAAAAASMTWGYSRGMSDSSDLMRRVEEVRLWSAHLDPYTDPDLTYPPSALPVMAILLAPIGGADRNSAITKAPLLKGWWFCLNLAALGLVLAAIIAIWGRAWPAWFQLGVVLWVASCRPVRAGLALGQFHLIPLALMLWTIPAVRANRSVLAGVLLGLALIKPTMGLPLLIVWMIQRQDRAWTTALVMQAGLWLICAMWLSVSPIQLGVEWLDNARGQLLAGTLDAPSILSHLLPGFPLDARGVSLAVLALGCLVMFHRRRASLETQTAFALLLASVFTYHRHYDLVLVLPALIVLANAAGWERGRSACWIAATVAALFIVPTNPLWIRPFEPWIEAAVAVSTYLSVALLAHRLGVECNPRAVEGHFAHTPPFRSRKGWRDEQCPRETGRRPNQTTERQA